ncbi:MAG: methionyl-tRNA formyltransferase [Bacteroidota bacterium]
MLDIVFMGTPDFAVPSLEMLHTRHNIKAVVTAPDKAAGRGRKIRQSPVKNFAQQHDLPCLQPQNLKDPGFVEQIKLLKPDLMVVVAFRMLPKLIWNIPPKGTFNLHASLLPQYRGAAPINHAIMNGEKQTGVTTFLIDDKIDTGNILLQEVTPISEDDTAGSLHDKLMDQGANLVLKTANAIEQDKITAKPQSTAKEAKTAPKIFRNDCEINWNKSGKDVYNFIRGLSPYPTAWTKIISDEKPSRLKVFEADFIEENHDSPTGSIRNIDNKILDVAVRDGFIRLKKIQAENKKPMNTEAFLQGYNTQNASFPA